MPEMNPQQLVFSGGVNPTAAPHLLAEDEVQTASNIDFSLVPGAAAVRRGSTKLWDPSGLTGTNTTTCWAIYRHYNNPSTLTSCPTYVQVGSTVYRGISGTFTAVQTAAHQVTGFTSYRQHVYITSTDGSKGVKDDGTTTTEWPLQSPSAKVTCTLGTLTSLALATAYTVAEGTLSGTATTTIAVVSDATTFRTQINATPLSTNLNVNGTSTIGDYGIDVVKIKFSDPAAVTRVSRDYSIGGTAFTNYWHTEMDVNVHEFLDIDYLGQTSDNALPDSDVLIESEQNVGTSTDTVIELDDKNDMVSEARRRARTPKIRISAAKDVFNVWSVPRTKFEMVNIASAPGGWDNIGAVRIVVEAESPVTVTVCDWEIFGAKDYPISDAQVGVAYWETFATISSNTLLNESAPSPASDRLKCQGARVVVVSTNTASGTNHGLTHRVFYRQGGYLNDAYAVGTTALATATFTDSLSDVQALSQNQRLERNLLTRSTFPANVCYISEPHYERLFVAHENKIRWSLPGRPDAFPRTSNATVSHLGDEVHGLVVWAPTLVVINRDSVYELHGDVFEGKEANWVLQRTGSRKGSKAPRTVIKTPYGIPLLDFDGLSMYVPGQGLDRPVDWAMAKLLDVFRGTGADAPAALKGSRVPALLGGAIDRAVAAYAEGKLYLGLSCGGSEVDPNTLFVLDFNTQKTWWYTYPFNFSALYWDYINNTLLAGTDDGKVMQLETTTVDQGANGTATNISWSFRTRAWTTANDCVLENISVEHKNAVRARVDAYYDNSTSSTTLGTLTNTLKDWVTPPLLGTVVNNVVFEFSGTQTASQHQAIYNIQWDALVEPKRVEYWRTEHDINNHDGEKSWDVHFADMEIVGTGTVAGTVYVDNTAIMTATYTGANNGRQIYPTSFPAHTYGDVGHAVYRAASGTLFKHWQTTYDARNEPPRITVWRTDVESLEENICDAMDLDVAPNGSVVSTVFVDNTAVGTYTSSGTDRRQSFTHALPNALIGTHTAPHGLYGRTIYAIHTGSNWKHYNTWFHLRPEPDRWTNHISERRSGNEKFWDTFEVDIDPIGGTTLATVVVDNTAVMTCTITGNGRKSYPFAMPEDTYGRTVYAAYAGSGTSKFKFYKDWFEGTDEPDRVTTVQAGPYMYPSNQYLKTWVIDMNPLGTVTGVLYVDHVVHSTATFTGTTRKTFNVGLDVSTAMVLQTAAYEVDVVYTGASGGVLKHYKTFFETDAKPFGKKTWSFSYKKIGGATQLDLARYWSFDIEAATSGTSTFTTIWDIDGVAFSTETFTLTGRRWQDRIPFPPGARGYLFQQRLLSDVDVQVWKTNVDIMRVGIKGLSRATVAGTPESPTSPDVRPPQSAN